jgi:hypothetical protein
MSRHNAPCPLGNQSDSRHPDEVSPVMRQQGNRMPKRARRYPKVVVRDWRSRQFKIAFGVRIAPADLKIVRHNGRHTDRILKQRKPARSPGASPRPKKQLPHSYKGERNPLTLYVFSIRLRKAVSVQQKRKDIRVEKNLLIVGLRHVLWQRRFPRRSRRFLRLRSRPQKLKYPAPALRLEIPLTVPWLAPRKKRREPAA